ncbi:MAG: YggU family protein [Rhodospirillaceae bacterium]|nr:YggU family protein [Rhodospirillaceae bacterium]|tara:strand:+ start:140 stop:466 length:327 start_codon:yes stop_codon:yes gene_type:complete
MPFRVGDDGLRVRLKVAPKAAANRVTGLAADADGGCVLKVAVTAPADKGKANAAVVKLLSKEWGVAKSEMEIVQGQSSRNKMLLIQGGGAALMRRLTDWCGDKGLETK